MAKSTEGSRSDGALVVELEVPPSLIDVACQRVHRAWEAAPQTFWLDSSGGPQHLARYSFVGTQPYAVLTGYGPSVQIVADGAKRQVSGDPFRVLAEWMAPVFARSAPTEIPFGGGAVGYLGYDLCHFVEELPRTAVRDLYLPDLAFGFYDTLFAVDHVERRAYLVSNGLPLTGAAAAKKAAARLSWLRAEVEAALAVPDEAGERTADGSLDWRRKGAEPVGLLQSTFGREAYLAALQRVKAYIAAGDIYQVNLAQRLTTPSAKAPGALYRRLRQVSPAPFSALLPAGDYHILSSSPERFMLMQGDYVETRPIKGTRPRGTDPKQDAARRTELLQSAKDAAEHVMIVDLERNDLGRFCRYGSVAVRELMVCEAYQNVFHLVSTVSGRLRQGVDRVECIRSAFPGGSITGAPKIRAMEIIDELEPVQRGVYTGSLGYLGLGGACDLNIAIRTMLLGKGHAHFHVGGGIVADSDAEDEYEETLDKAEGLVRAVLGGEAR